MRTLLIPIFTAVLALLVTDASANSIIYKLPKDGTWAVYEGDYTMEIGDRRQEGKGKLWIGSVGETTVDGKKCRWIEARFDMPRGNSGRDKSVLKFLVPEEELAKGRSPLEHVVRAWFKDGSKGTKKIENANKPTLTPLPLLLAPPLKNEKKLPAEKVTSKLGELSCEGVTGTFKMPVPEALASTLSAEITVENRLSDKAPFGVITFKWVNRAKMGSQMPPATQTIDFKLTDLGTDAKSKLPKKN